MTPQQQVELEEYKAALKQIALGFDSNGNAAWRMAPEKMSSIAQTVLDKHKVK